MDSSWVGDSRQASGGTSFYGDGHDQLTPGGYTTDGPWPQQAGDGWAEMTMDGGPPWVGHVHVAMTNSQQLSMTTTRESLTACFFDFWANTPEKKWIKDSEGIAATIDYCVAPSNPWVSLKKIHQPTSWRAHSQEFMVSEVLNQGQPPTISVDTAHRLPPPDATGRQCEWSHPYWSLAAYAAPCGNTEPGLPAPVDRPHEIRSTGGEAMGHRTTGVTLMVCGTLGCSMHLLSFRDDRS